MKCPSCGNAISWDDASTVEFRCPNCGHGVQIKGSYFRALYLVAFVVIVLAAFAADLQHRLLYLTIFGIWPVYLALVFITARLFPPDTKATGDFRGILYGPVPRSADQVPEAITADLQPTPTTDEGRELFHVSDPPRTFEGLFGRGIVLIVLAGNVWLAAEPFLSKLAPELWATKTGPRGFPVIAHIEEDGITFRNTVAVELGCKVELGYRQSLEASLRIPANGEATLAYAAAGRPTARSASEVKRAAQTVIDLTCGDASGKSYWARLD